MSFKCPKCGAELSDGTKFCSECGEKIELKKEPENPYEDTDSFRSIEYDPINWKRQYIELRKHSKKFNMLKKARKLNIWPIIFEIFTIIMGFVFFFGKFFTEKITGDKYSIISAIKNRNYFSYNYPNVSAFNMLDLFIVLVVAFFFAYTFLAVLTTCSLFDKKFFTKHYCVDSGLALRTRIQHYSNLDKFYGFIYFITMGGPLLGMILAFEKVTIGNVTKNIFVFTTDYTWPAIIFIGLLVLMFVVSITVVVKQDKILKGVFPKAKVKKY